MLRWVALGVALGRAGLPLLQALVGKEIEVCWKYTNKDTGEAVLIWTPGRVERVADGLSDTRSARAQKILPAGALLWA